MWHGEFRHPRLVEVYDAAFGRTRDDDFFVSVLEQEPPGGRVVDLGCGTGRLALALAARGYRVTGVDPARASLDAARAKPGADLVTWVEGTSRTLPSDAFEVALMTSHVAQFMVDDRDWGGALADLYRCLVQGGRLAFDTRDPAARGWEAWNRQDSLRSVTLPDGLAVSFWTQVTLVTGDTVELEHRYDFSDGQELSATAVMRFRNLPDIEAALAGAGFMIDDVHGGWQREPVGAGDGELLVLARRPGGERVP